MKKVEEGKDGEEVRKQWHGLTEHANKIYPLRKIMVNISLLIIEALKGKDKKKFLLD
ncbi:unnamed protein product [Sphenostylis stenocarpa]|uniref:Uncharacterized protein n=1 Tax=Sphenostylis stenocarpa TaxID=92480 RepID=A0AA86VWK8_9FABA|nr:unnamed protein product [Sphenostylis stenocarpa]